jgi:DNA-binding LytR/AlgR family response regulator
MKPEKTVEQYESENFLQSDKLKDSILIKINKKYKKISKSNIDFIASDGKYSNLHIGNRIYSVRTSLKNVEEILPHQFLRIHASFIVNTSKIESINTETCQIEFEVGISIPYSRTYKSKLLKMYSIM